MRKTILAKTMACFGAIFLMAAVTAHAVSVAQCTATKGTYSSYITASWPASAYAHYGYYVFRTPTAKFANPVQLGKTSNRYWVDRTASAGREYWYWIAPIYSKSVSYRYFYSGRTRYRRTYTTWYYYRPISNDTAFDQQGGWRAFTIPTPTVSKGKSTTGLYVSWSGSAQAKNGYVVWRGTTANRSSAVRLGKTYSRSFLDTSASLVPGKTYYYWISVCGFNVTVSHPAKWGKGWLAMAVPYTKGYQSGNSVYLYWAASKGASKYRIYRGRTSAFSSANWVGTTAGTSWTDWGVSRGYRYYWWIVPVDVEARCWKNVGKWGTLLVQ